MHTDIGPLNFQEFYLREQCRPVVRQVTYDGASAARATPETLAALADTELLVVAPSNPAASIGPILAVPGLRQAIAGSPALKVAVSPIVAGKSLKGPSDRMLKALGFEPSPLGVAEFYGDLVDGLVIDDQDSGFAETLTAKGLNVLVTNTVMKTREDRVSLARQVLDWSPFE